MPVRSTFVWGANEKPVFCGDSLVAGNVSGPGGVSVSWDVPLMASMNASLTSTVNCRCVDGGRTPAASWDIQGFVATQMNYWAANATTLVTGKSATIIFVAWGRNDAAAGTAPATTKANLKTGVQAVEAIEPGKKWVIMDAMQDGPVLPGVNGAALVATNQGLSDGADELAALGYNICYVAQKNYWDTQILPVYNPTNSYSLYTLDVDNLHLNALGARLQAVNLWTYRVAA